MPAYTDVESTRTTTPDPVALLTGARAALGDATAVLTWRGDGQWTVKSANTLSAAQVTAVQTAIDAAADRDEAAVECDQKVLKALSLGLWECIPTPTLTKAQLRNRIIAIWRTL